MGQIVVMQRVLYESSSGEATILALIARHPARILKGIVHEVPFSSASELSMKNLSDREIVERCQKFSPIFSMKIKLFGKDYGQSITLA